MSNGYEAEKGSGLIAFAGVMILIAGTLNIIGGIAAISDSHFYAVNAHYIISSLNTWGWVVLVIGVLEFLAAFSIWNGTQWGRWFGVLIVGLNAIGQLLMLPAYPLWSLSIFAINLIILYALLAYGGQGRKV